MVGEELVILAVAKRRFVARLKLSDCAESHYNHATGEFIIETPGELLFNRFRLSPREAARLSESMNLRPVGPKS